jgi:hypothetical protein
VYFIEQEDLTEDLMTVRTRFGLLKGWYFPNNAVGGVAATRYHPTPYDGPQHKHFPTEPTAVGWITASTD